MRLDRSQLVFALKAAALGFAVALVYAVVVQRWPQPTHSVEIVHASREAKAGSSTDARGGQISYAVAVAAAAPSVVNIYTATQTRPASGFDSPLFEQLFGDRSGTGDAHNIRTGAGSGVIVSSAGYIVTNNHLIADTDEINVMLNTGESYPAHVIGTDPETDLAVIRIDVRELPAIALAADSHHGHRQRDPPRQRRLAYVRGLHSDRCGHQSGQFGRRADQPQRRVGGSEHGDLHAE
jgi:S1-C subfamily serine protease